MDSARMLHRGMLMSHMLADTSAELLAMADRIGVARRWLQHAGTAHEHFDICQTKRADAIRAGARMITRRELAQLLRHRRKQNQDGRRLPTP